MYRISCCLVIALALLLTLSPGKAADDQPAAPQRRANRLARESSPYLLLHAHNPVDWHPWGPEAFERARQDNKLVFLSIGYSSCYWCHVMERESFMDDEVARFLNEHFVCVKVDREERPDVDEIYMTSQQVTGRPTGWPLTVFLLPNGQPVIGGTYFPPRDRELPQPADAPADAAPQVQMGLLTLVARVHSLWQDQPEQLQEMGRRVTDAVRRTLDQQQLADEPLPDSKLLAEAQAGFAEQFDPVHGGFGYSESQPGRPKFPEPPNLELLLWQAGHGDAQARDMLVATLDAMANRGLNDHVGGGFHRYSTDRFWRVPHFEKMLYDNGQLLSVYAQAWKLTGNERYRDVAEHLVEYVAREMTAPEGGFYSALDAQTEGHEGAYYVWSPDEVRAALGDSYAPFAAAFGLDGKPNFEGRYILMPQPGVPAEALRDLAPARQAVLQVRQQRTRPLVDVKIQTSWNGLMIRGLADAGRLFNQPEYLARASQAADFVLSRLRDDRGRLWHVHAGGKSGLNGYLDDFAFFIEGLLALHQATGEPRWLAAADELMQLQIDHFWDEARGGFYFTANDHETLIARSKNPVDLATPSGNAVSVSNLLALSAALDKPDYRQRAEQTLRAFATLLARAPTALPRMAVGLAQYHAQTKP